MYSPLMFLSALGAGGISITFFLWLMFWVAHPGQPIPIYDDVVRDLTTGTVTQAGMIVSALAGIGYFAVKHVSLMIRNVQQLLEFRASGACDDLSESDAVVQRLAIPLASSMSVNVMLILGAVFVPGLWSVVEYLFPIALLAFAVIGFWALGWYASIFRRAMDGKFNMDANATFAQVLPAFTFGMVAVGLAAPAAMSHNTFVVTLATVLSIFFFVASVFLGLLKLISGFHQMFTHGIKEPALPTLWIVVPIITVLSIALIRMDHGIAHTLHVGEGASWFVYLTIAVALQAFILFLGYQAMANHDYLARVYSGEVTAPATLSLVCPGVAFAVLLQFWINKGLVAAGIIAKFGIAYWTLTAIPLVVTVLTIMLFMRLLKTVK